MSSFSFVALRAPQPAMLFALALGALSCRGLSASQHTELATVVPQVERQKGEQITIGCAYCLNSSWIPRYCHPEGAEGSCLPEISPKQIWVLECTDKILRNYDLVGKPLRYADFSRSLLISSNLEGADLRGAHGHGATFRKLSGDKANFSHGHFVNAVFVVSNLEDALFVGANIFPTSFRGSHLEKADFRYANLRQSSFKNANLKGAQFAGAFLRKVDFAGAKLEGADFTGADVTGAHFAGAEGMQQTTGLPASVLKSAP